MEAKMEKGEKCYKRSKEHLAEAEICYQEWKLQVAEWKLHVAATERHYQQWKEDKVAVHEGYERVKRDMAWADLLGAETESPFSDDEEALPIPIANAPKRRLKRQRSNDK